MTERPFFLTGESLPYWLLAILYAAHIVCYYGAIQSDGAIEMAIAEGLWEGNGLQLAGSPDTHFPPVIPLALLPFLAAMGFNSFAVHTAQMFYLALAAFLAFKLGELHKEGSGKYLAAAVLLDPVIFGSVMGSTSEVVLLTLILATVHSFLRSPDNPAWLVPTAFFASLTYLTKASSLVLAVVASAAFLTYARRYIPSLLSKKNFPHLVGAAVAFLLPIGLWSWRNYTTLGNADTNTYTSSAFSTVIYTPGVFVREILIYAIVYSLWIVVLMAPFTVVSRKNLRDMLASVAAERNRPLLLVYAVLILMAVLVGAALITYEPGIYTNPYFSVQHIRYVTIGNVILLAMLLASTCRERWRKPMITVFAVFIVLIPPVVAGEMAFVDEYSSMSSYLDDRGVTEVWSDGWADIKYNIPDVKVHLYRDIADVPDNSTVITTRVVDTGEAREFWRYAVTMHLLRPLPIGGLEANYTSSSFSATLRLKWDPSTAEDLDHYLVVWDTRNHSDVREFAYKKTVLSTTAMITGLDPGETYHIAVVAVDTHGNFNASARPITVAP